METLLEDELHRLESLGIIERAHLSDWSSPIVIVKRHDGRIRLCVDYSTGVNNSLKNNPYPLPNVDNIVSKLNGNSYFSVLDLSDAFLQIEVAEDSRDITTITTTKGLFKFKRLPFGVKTAPAIFQQAMDYTLSGLEGVHAYLDDVIIAGPSRKEHDVRLRSVLQRLEEKGWKLKAKKCRFALTEIRYLGLIINGSGIAADPDKTRAIANMPKPTRITEVQALLGMVNHYGKFIPHLHQIKQPLEDLTRKNCHWNWERRHDTALERIKEVMLSPLLLEHFDPSKTLIVAADACLTGIGGVLLQRDRNGHERAVYHMSQSLTNPQRNYSQLEKEALALVTAVERFHKFLWGRKFILQTDHKPLVALLRPDNTKGLKPTTAARLKRWAIRLLGYDFQIEFVRTQDFGQADALSRLIEEARRDNLEELQVTSIRSVENEVRQISNYSIDYFGKNLRLDLQSATNSDPDLQTVISAIRNKWSSTPGSTVVEHYKIRREHLSVVNDTLLMGDRVVIPPSLQSKILSSLHKGHPGIRRMKQLAREYVYWPKMSSDIERLVQQCDACALVRKFPVKVPIHSWPVPTRPLERLHIDFAGPLDGQYLLIFADAYSKFVEVSVTPTISATRTVELCREMFSRYGPPEILVSDHGTQFTSTVFANFCKEMHISHLFSAVNHPQSNGQAERMVDIVKKAIAKNPSDWRTELQDFLYSYRYTPSSAAPDGKSPAEVFLGRRITSPFTKLLSTTTESFAPSNDLAKKQQMMEEQFRQHHGARPRSLKLQDRVVVALNDNKREMGYVSEILSQSRYLVRLDTGRIVERHINHIWKGGSTPAACPGTVDNAISDEWIFYEPDADLIPTQQICDSADSEHPAQSSKNVILPQDNHECAQKPAPIAQPSPRPSRLRSQPHRLILDPKAKSYV